MAMANKMTKVILGIVIAGLMLGYVFPVGLNAINENPTYDVTTEEGVQTQVSGPLDVNVTSSTAGSSATVELINTNTGDTESNSVNVGETVEYTQIEGGTANVTVNSVESGTPNTIGLGIETNTGFGWSGASQSIFSVIGIFLVIVPLVVLAREAMNA